MGLGPPRQIPYLFIKSFSKRLASNLGGCFHISSLKSLETGLIEVLRKWPWGHLGSFFTTPYQILIKVLGKMNLEPPGQFMAVSFALHQ